MRSDRYSFRLELAAKSDAGLVRSSNQDAALVVPRLSLALVADGMVGHPRDDLASEIAVEAFRDRFAAVGGAGDDEAVLRGRMAAALRHTDERVRAQRSAVGGPGVGASLVAVSFSQEHVVVAHTGDSRCYRWRDHSLTLLTGDPSHAAGPNIHSQLHQPHDVYLLCSDGLWGTASPEAIADAIAAADEVAQMCSALVGVAWAAGGLDNIGVAVARVMPNLLRLGEPGAHVGAPADESAGEPARLGC